MSIKDDRRMAEPRAQPGGRKPPGPFSRIADTSALAGRAWSWARSHPRLAIGGAAGIAVAGIVTFTLLALAFPSSGDAAATVAEALAALRAGNVREARELAVALRDNKNLSYADRGAVLYVLGCTVAADAEAHTNPAERRVLYLIASRYLEEARLCGIPAGHEPAALTMLGKCLYLAGKPDAAVPVLRQALGAAEDRSELYEYLARAYLESSPPDAHRALEYNQRYLAEAALTAEQQSAALLQQGEIYLVLGDVNAGRQALEKIPTESAAHPRAVLLSIRLLVGEVEAAGRTRNTGEPLSPELHDMLMAAVGELSRMEHTPRLDTEIKAQAQLLQAVCHAQLNDQAKAIPMLLRVRRNSHGTPEAIAATILEAELHLGAGRTDEALRLLQRALQDAEVGNNRNPWLSRSQLEARLANAFQRFLQLGEFAKAVDLASALPPRLDEVVAYQWRAQAHHAWAEQLATQAAQQPRQAAEALRIESRSHFRKAGADYERLAELRLLTRHYLDDLSRSAVDYLAGQGYRQAARVFRKFLHAQPQEGRAEALTGLGEALLAIGDVDGALAALRQCRDDFPKHPASYKARYLASLALQERGELAEARQMLLDNLYNLSLTPESAEWRDSLFLLGRLRHREGVELEAKSRQAGVDSANLDLKRAGHKVLEQSHAALQDAIRILDEAIRRYPQAAQAVEARYLLAESHRQAAKWPRKRLELATIEASKAPLVRQMRNELDAAVAEYETLITKLSGEGEGAGLVPLDQSILRNSFFARADALFDLGRYDDAAEAYSAATNRYQNEPESLSAYIQIASCYRRQNRTSEARGTLEQARLVLQRIRKDADFKKTTPYSRDEWNSLINWLGAL
jgi:tetratricopeptide (TPR) repeat protein